MSSHDEQADNKVVRKLQLAGILSIVGVVILYLLALSSSLLLPLPWRYGVWVGAILIPWSNRIIQPCIFLFRKSHAGATLLNLGYLNKLSGWDITIYVLLWIMLWLIASSRTPESSRAPEMLIIPCSVVVLYIAMTASKIIASQEPTFITEKGIYNPQGTVLWNKIESRQWLNRDGCTLLILKMKRWPWPLGGKTMKVPSAFKADVDRILREKGIT